LRGLAGNRQNHGEAEPSPPSTFNAYEYRLVLIS
jgi:hypothetical protein